MVRTLAAALAIAGVLGIARVAGPAPLSAPVTVTLYRLTAQPCWSVSATPPGADVSFS